MNKEIRKERKMSYAIAFEVLDEVMEKAEGDNKKYIRDAVRVVESEIEELNSNA